MSRADRFDRADFEARYATPDPVATDEPVDPAAPAAALPMLEAPIAPKPASASMNTPSKARRAIWPIAREHVQRVGDSVLADRNGRGRPHKGVDIFAEAGTSVIAARGGQVLRVVDGRQTKTVSQQRAGLFIDVRGGDALVYRYLHLGESRVVPGASIKQGTVLGTVAAAHTSGLAETPHLHFEIRQGDYEQTRQDYGLPLDPRRLLPPLRA